MNGFSLTISLTKKDLQDFNIESIFKFRPFYTQPIFWFYVIIFAGITLRPIIEHRDNTLSIDLFLGPLSMVAAVFLIRWIYLRKATKFYESNIKIQRGITYTFDYNQIHAKGHNSETVYGWDEIFKIIKSKRFLIVYITTSTALILPLTMVTPEQIDFIESAFKTRGQFSNPTS